MIWRRAIVHPCYAWQGFAGGGKGWAAGRFAHTDGADCSAVVKRSRRNRWVLGKRVKLSWLKWPRKNGVCMCKLRICVRFYLHAYIYIHTYRVNIDDFVGF